jgi:hypothetical protein
MDKSRSLTIPADGGRSPKKGFDTARRQCSESALEASLEHSWKRPLAILDEQRPLWKAPSHGTTGAGRLVAIRGEASTEFASRRSPVRSRYAPFSAAVSGGKCARPPSRRPAPQAKRLVAATMLPL